MFVIKEITVKKLCWVNVDENQVEIVGKDSLTWKLKSKFQVARSAEKYENSFLVPTGPKKKLKILDRPESRYP